MLNSKLTESYNDEISRENYRKLTDNADDQLQTTRYKRYSLSQCFFCCFQIATTDIHETENQHTKTIDDQDIDNQHVEDLLTKFLTLHNINPSQNTDRLRDRLLQYHKRGLSDDSRRNLKLHLIQELQSLPTNSKQLSKIKVRFALSFDHWLEYLAMSLQFLGKIYLCKQDIKKIIAYFTAPLNQINTSSVSYNNLENVIELLELTKKIPRNFQQEKNSITNSMIEAIETHAFNALKYSPSKTFNSLPVPLYQAMHSSDLNKIICKLEAASNIDEKIDLLIETLRDVCSKIKKLCTTSHCTFNS